MNQVKRLYLCETQYHLFNALRIILFDGLSGDVCLCRSIPNVDMIKQKLDATGIVENVYLMDTYSGYVGRNGFFFSLIKLMLSLYRFIAYKRNIIRRIQNFADFSKQHYEVLFYASPTMSAYNIMNLIRPKIINLLDDGTGIYRPNGLIMSKYPTLKHRIFHMFFPWLLMTFDIKTLYANSPDAFSYSCNYNIKKIGNNFSKDKYALEVIKNAFFYNSSSLLKSFRFIFLSQPPNIDKKGGDLHKKVMDILLSDILNYELIIRLHPRDGSSDKGYSCAYDETLNSWELECIESITEKHILISYYSTALFSPKLIADKEPTCIFLYNIYKEYIATSEIQIISNYIDYLKSAYHLKEKIYTPDTLADLRNILRDCVK